VRLPGFALPRPIQSAQKEFDEEFARTLEAMATRLEGKPAGGRDDFDMSLQHLEQIAEAYAATQPSAMLAAGLGSCLARNRRISAVTCALLQEI